MTEGTWPKGVGNYDLYASEVNSLARTKASGTLTVPADTVSGSPASVDIDFTAGELGAEDVLIVELCGQNDSSTGGGDTLRYPYIRAVNTTAEGSICGIGDSYAQGTYFIEHAIIMQNPSASDEIIGIIRSVRSADASHQVGIDKADTGDTNVFTTAWTLRILSYYGGTTGDEDSYIKYSVKIVPGV